MQCIPLLLLVSFLFYTSIKNSHKHLCFHCSQLNTLCIFYFNGKIFLLTEIDECASSPCQNGSSCLDQVNSFTCNCHPGYTGTLCNININECATLPCQNGATCVDLINSYLCQCLGGYQGSNCEFDINECASNPCVNNGQCTQGVNNFVCSCPIGFAGTRCELGKCSNSR